MESPGGDDRQQQICMSLGRQHEIAKSDGEREHWTAVGQSLNVFDDGARSGAECPQWRLADVGAD